MKMSVDQAFRKAQTLSRSGDNGEAELIYREILDRFPGNRRAQGELQALLTPAIENPPTAQLDALVGLYQRGQMTEALTLGGELLARFPYGEILHNIVGAVNFALGHPETALTHYDAAISLAADYVEAFNNRGNALKELKRLDEALASFDSAILLKPDYAEAHANRGLTLTTLMRLDEALAGFDKAIDANPQFPEAYNGRANALKLVNRPAAALADYDRAVRLRPDYADAWVNRGNILKALARLEDAVASYDKAITLTPNLAEAHGNRGVVLRFLKRPDEAVAAFRKALELKPDYVLALSEMLYVQAHMCDWTWVSHGEELSRLALAGAPVPPFHMLNIDDDPAHQLAYARTWAQSRYARGQSPEFPARKNGHERGGRIRIGYFSADFHNHATMMLIARMLELHDKNRFEIHAFSYGINVRDAMRERLLNAVDMLHDVASLSDQNAAHLARSCGIDIAVDLKGFTENTRSGIFAYRAAPVQVGYLGYPGTMGAEFIDFFLADEITVPEASRSFFSEEIIYLPHSYQVNDDKRAIADRIFTRSELGLPETGFIFCSFNNNYKITPAEFDIWMRLLAKVEGSVLWLLQDNEWAAGNLRKEAQARGIDPARLVFAERLPFAEHLARQRCADLFLDTFKVNAHTTASDALWAGLPLLTRMGESFVARVAGSLLHAIGVPELATESIEDYERLALELATDPERLAALRARIAANRLTSPLFDTARYTRDLEQVFERLAAESAT